LNKQESLHHVLIGLFTYKFGRAEMLQSKLIAEELLALAQSTQKSIVFMQGYYAMGCLLFALGDFQTADDHFEQAFAHYDPDHHQVNLSFFGFNLNLFARSFHAHTLWMLGRSEQAMQQMQATIAQARSLAHPFSLALTLAYAAMLHQFRREPAMAQQLAAEAMAVCTKHGNPYYGLWATMLHTWAEAVQGNNVQVPGTLPETEIHPIDGKLASLQRSIENLKATESRVRLPFYLSLAVDLCLRTGEAEQGLATLHEAEALAAANSETWWTAELHRLRGELLQGQGATAAEVEACFSASIEVARRQGARLLELRATVSLARLWAAEGKQEEACQRLATLLDSFTEGWDTPDLQDAQTLLKRLRGGVSTL
jgi:tetratricopeptide (TPR) repeat protein